MAVEFIYPVGYELKEIESDLISSMTEPDDPLPMYFPDEDSDAPIISWEQRDPSYGLMQVRGVNGEPPRVSFVGGRRFMMEPGYYGEYMPIDEHELTYRRPWGQYAGRVDATTQVRERHDFLLQRQTNRIKQIKWDLLLFGRFSVMNVIGTTTHADAVDIRMIDSAVDWRDSVNATPLADLRNLSLMGEGTSTTFDSTTEGVTSQRTIHSMLTNRNQNDIAGQRTQAMATLNGTEDFNRIYTGEGLPSVRAYQGGYMKDLQSWQLYIPNGYIVFFGRRPGSQPVGRFLYTPNANNDNFAPGPYVDTYESPRPPRHIETHRGFNGGPAFEYPNSVVVLRVWHHDYTP